MEPEFQLKKRYKVAIDTFSLLEDDGVVASAEDVVEGQQMFFDIIKSLDDDKQRFVAICLHNGFNNLEIALMLDRDPSRVTRYIQAMRIKIREFLSEKATK